MFDNCTSAIVPSYSGTAGQVNYQNTYETMLDDELLRLALRMESLVPDARVALIDELQKRNLTPADVTQYARDIASREQERMKRRQSSLATSLNGFGTALYGKRDFRPDGSYVTTKWVVFAWIPLLPLNSLRVELMGPGEPTFLPGWSQRYFVQSSTLPNVKQVACVYLFVFTLFCVLLALDRLPSALAFLAPAALPFLPWVLRTRARTMAEGGSPAGALRVLWSEALAMLPGVISLLGIAAGIGMAFLGWVASNRVMLVGGALLVALSAAGYRIISTRL